MVLNIEVGVGEPTNLGGKNSVWKVLILLHKLAPQQFHVNVIVGVRDVSNAYMVLTKEWTPQKIAVWKLGADNQTS